MNILHCVPTVAKYEKQNPYLVYRRFNWRQRRHIQYKNSQLVWCFKFLGLPVQLVVANSRERVYFEQQILTLLLFHPTPNFSRIKFAHISRQVESFCISWSSLKAFHIRFHMKPSMLRQNQRTEKQQELPLATMQLRVANNNLCYNLRLPWRRKKEIRPNF